MSLKLTLYGLLVAAVLITACAKKDTTNPVITINGEKVVTVSLNSAYNDAGATATDDKDGTLNVTVSGKANPDFAGVYYITYKASDAAGNEGQAIRTVIVRNDAGIYNGSYSTMTIIGADTTYYNASSTVSNLINYRIWLVGYSNVPTAAVYADLHHDTVIIPHQIIPAGLSSQIHSFSGFGFVKSISDHTVFEISFSDSVSGTIYTGTSVYTKSN